MSLLLTYTKYMGKISYIFHGFQIYACYRPIKSLAQSIQLIFLIHTVVLFSFIEILPYINGILSKGKSYDAMTTLSITRFPGHTCS
jgi:hypothetical protein